MDELTSSNLGATIITSSNPLARVESAVNATHSSYYLKNLRKTVEGLNSDTYVAPGSYRTILTATSCWLSALDLASSSSGPAFALTRPPGHHATKEAGMGFCLVNFCACSALEFLKENENKKVAVLDIDVHFGNGSAAILKGLKRARFASVHERGIYPGSGESKAEGENVLKLPVPSGCLGPEWLKHVNRALDFVLADDPDLLIVSVGYDALSEDPLAGLNLTPDNYAEVRKL